MAVVVDLKLHTSEFEASLKTAIQNGLTKVGMQAMRYARDKCPTVTSRLKRSINYEVKDDTVTIGTDVEYASYIEFGTGIYNENGKTSGYWVWVDDGGGGSGGVHAKRHSLEEAKKIVAILRSQGKPAFYSNGAKAQHFLRPAATEHNEAYTKLMQTELQKIK